MSLQHRRSVVPLINITILVVLGGGGGGDGGSGGCFNSDDCVV